MNKSKKALHTRQQIIAIASLMFLEKGYYATSVQDIIDSVHISKGAFYYHFDSKLDLYRTIIYQFLDIDNKLIALDEIKQYNLTKAFKIVVENHYNYLKELIQQTNFSIAHFQRLYYESLIILPEIYQKVKTNYQKYHNFFKQKAVEELNLTEEQASALVKRLIFEYDGMFAWMSIFPDTSIDEIVEAVMSEDLKPKLQN